MPQSLDASVSAADPTRAGADGQLAPQQCGRCRLLFDGDPTLHPPARPGWWLCPQCRTILLGRTRQPNDAAPRPHVGDTP